MARSRVAAVGACCLLALAATVGGAKAQTAGGPLPLLQIDHAKEGGKTLGKTAIHARRKAAERMERTKLAERRASRHMARRVHAKMRVAERARELPAPPPAPPQTAPQNDSRTIWPAPAAAMTGNSLPGTAPAVAPATSVVTERVVDSDPNAILNGGHAVPAALPAPAKPAPSALKPLPAAPDPTTASSSAPVNVAAAAAPIAPKPTVRAMLFKPRPSGPVGSASWLAHVLAALGGAIAAGGVAWLLIRPAPERTAG